MAGGPWSEQRDGPIAIRGARVHNLQGVDCDLPRNRLTVITGPSGSGKSSLAFDTLYAEGQRRYVESLSPYARQFLEQLEKPEVESVSGLSPAIAIDQRTEISHPRSTVGTVTEVYDHLRVLFSALGRPHCPRCARADRRPDAEQMGSTAPTSSRRAHRRAGAGRARPQGSFRQELEGLAQPGSSARASTAAPPTSPPPALDPRRNHRIEVLVERLVLRDGAQKRRCRRWTRRCTCGRRTRSSAGGQPERLQPAPPARTAGSRCPRCRPALLVQQQLRRLRGLRRPGRALAGGPAQRDARGGPVGPGRAILPWQRHGPRLVREALQDVARRHGFSLDAPLRELSRSRGRSLLHGDGDGFVGVLPASRRRVEAALGVGGEEAPRPAAAAEAFEELRPS